MKDFDGIKMHSAMIKIRQTGLRFLYEEKQRGSSTISWQHGPYLITL